MSRPTPGDKRSYSISSSSLHIDSTPYKLDRRRSQNSVDLDGEYELRDLSYDDDNSNNNTSHENVRELLHLETNQPLYQRFAPSSFGSNNTNNTTPAYDTLQTFNEPNAQTYDLDDTHKHIPSVAKTHASVNNDILHNNLFPIDKGSPSSGLPTSRQTNNKPREAGILFPEISKGSFKLKDQSNMDVGNSRPPSVIHMIDDTASIDIMCIDDTAEPLESMARAIIKSTPVAKSAPNSSKQKLKKGSSAQGKIGSILSSMSGVRSIRGHKRTPSLTSVPDLPSLPEPQVIESVELAVESVSHYSGEAIDKLTPLPNNPFGNSASMDFEEYKRQTANQLLSERRRERRQKRQLRRRMRALRKEQYFGNYFREQDPNLDGDVFDNVEFSHVSYAVDHFNGNRQNNPFYHLDDMYNESSMNDTSISNNHLHSSNQVVSSGVSFRTNQTDNIDDMSSNDSDNSDEIMGFGSSQQKNTFSNSLPSEHDDFDNGSEESEEYDSDFSNMSLENPKKGLKRKLYSRHLTSIGAASAIGVSAMLILGRTLFTAGPLGSLLGFMITGSILYSVIVGYGEMVSLIPLHTGVTGTISRFVSPSVGYAIGFCYWLSNAVALPAELTAAAMMLTNYPELSENGVLIVWIIYIFFLVLLINVFSVRIYGEFQFTINLVRIVFLSVLSIVLINNARHGLGFGYWKSSQSDPENETWYGAFRPLFPVHVVANHSVNDVVIWGIPGGAGRFLQIWQSTLEASRGYLNVPIVYSSVGEARNPRKSLTRATRYIFWQIILFYIISVFILGINVYAGDADLFGIQRADITDGGVGIYKGSNYHSNQNTLRCSIRGNGNYNAYEMGLNVTPWIIALQSAGQCVFAGVMNAVFVIFAVSSGSSYLYASSRTLYGLVRMYIEDNKIKYPSWWNLCGWCNSQGVPTYAVLVSFPFSFLALMNIKSASFAVFQELLVVSGSASVVVWVGMAVAFLRFHKAIETRNKNARIEDSEGQIRSMVEDLSRDDLAYPLKSPFQPYLAWFGLIGSSLLVVTMGMSVFLHDNWDTQVFIATYISPFLFCVVYCLHRFTIGTKFPPISSIDLDSGRRELDRAEWEEDRKYTSHGIYSIWRWILGRFRFVGVLFRTIQGNDAYEEEDMEVIMKKKKKKSKSKANAAQQPQLLI